MAQIRLLFGEILLTLTFSRNIISDSWWLWHFQITLATSLLNWSWHRQRSFFYQQTKTLLFFEWKIMDDIMTICFWWLFIITNSLLDNLILVPPNFLDFLKVFRKKSQWSRRSLTTLVTLFFGFPPYFLGDILKNIGLSEQNGLCRWPPWFVGASLLWTLWTSCSRSNLFQGPTQKVSFLCIVSFWLVCFLYYVSYTAQFDFVPSEKLYELCTYKT